MAGSHSTQTISSGERSLPAVDYRDKLSKWVFFSLLLHGAVILALFVVPFLPSNNRPSYPIYTVDLVGGEKIGGNNLGTELFPSGGGQGTTEKGNAGASASDSGNVGKRKLQKQ